MPCLSSCCLINGILTQFAAATATNGTNLPIIPADNAGELDTILLNKSAVATLADDAAAYAVPSCSVVTPADAK